jgi:hypothetical protein
VIKKKTNSKGSLTVEACVSFPVFLLIFYLFLFLVKAACINLVLDHAVSETARYLAAVSYPLSLLNEYEDEKTTGLGQLPSAGDRGFSLENMTGDGSGKGVLRTLLSLGEMGAENLDLILAEMKTCINSGFPGAREVEALEAISKEYLILKDSGKYLLAKEVLQRHLEDNGLDEEQTRLLLVKLPEGQAEYTAHILTGAFAKVPMQPDRDFTRDDVVIFLEYPLELPVFIPGRELVLRHAAVERAWLKGSNGVYTNREEGLERPGEKENYVYATRTGRKYHLYSSCPYLEKSRVPMTREEAESQGLSPHAGCPHRFR